jgi:hypothetical protein
MKNSVISVLMMTMVLFALPASAYIIDGNMDDWGVTPFVDWTPNAGAEHVVENNTNRAPSDPFNEIWDIEAMYFDDDDDDIYFGIVSSNPYKNDWASEDLLIDVNNNGVGEFGADVANLSTGLHSKGVYDVNSWKTYRGIEYAIKNGTKVGTYEIYNRYLGKVEPGVHSWQAGTYVLEGRISKLLFGPIACGQAIRLQFARITCLKDWIDLVGVCDGNCPNGNDVIPEPATIFLLGSGIAGLFVRRFKKKV